MRKSDKEHTGDAWACRAEEGRGTLREVPVSRVQALEPEISEWGNPVWVIPRYAFRGEGTG